MKSILLFLLVAITLSVSSPVTFARSGRRPFEMELSPPPKWPLPPLNKSTREKRLADLFSSHHLNDAKVHAYSISDAECRSLFSSLEDAGKHRVLEPDILTQKLTDPRITTLQMNCPRLNLGRVWEPPICHYSLCMPEWETLPADKKDEKMPGRRYTANFELYDLAPHGAANGYWAFYGEGPIHSCPRGHSCPGWITSTTSLPGFYNETNETVFNTKTCEKSTDGLLNARAVRDPAGNSEFFERPAFYGLAVIDKKIVEFSLAGNEPPDEHRKNTDELALVVLPFNFKRPGMWHSCVFEWEK